MMAVAGSAVPKMNRSTVVAERKRGVRRMGLERVMDDAWGWWWWWLTVVVSDHVDGLDFEEGHDTGTGDSAASVTGSAS